MKKTFYFVSLFLMPFLVVSCIEKRPDREVPGSALAKGHVVKKSEVLSQENTLSTQNKIQEVTGRSYKLTIEDSAKDLFDDFGLVEYKTDSNLLYGDVEVLGKENTRYKLIRKLEGENLIVYKVSKNASDFSYIEKTRLRDFESGLVGAPLLSFPVTYYNVRYLKDNDNRDTSDKIEDRVLDHNLYASATHLSVDWTQRKVLTDDISEKENLFPKDFFEDQKWYFSVFKIGTSDFQSGGNHYLGIYSEESGQFGPFRKIKFEAQNENTYAAVSAALPREFRDKALSQSTVAPLEVAWVKYKKPDSVFDENREEEDRRANFQDADYLKIDFVKSFKRIKDYVAFSFTDVEEPKRLKEVIVAEDLFSFIVETETSEYRVNFYKVPKSDYKPLALHFDDVVNHFGTWAISTPEFRLENNRVNAEIDFYNYFRTQRFDPEKKEIVYHLSEESPHNKAVESSSKTAVKYINDAFRYIYKDSPEEAIHVVLSDQRVRAGDPRYNIIDYSSPHNIQTVGGLGGPYYDEESGEVVKATSFIYYGLYEYLIEKNLIEYLSNLTGLYSSSETYVEVRSASSQAQALLGQSDYKSLYFPQSPLRDDFSHALSAFQDEDLGVKPDAHGQDKISFCVSEGDCVEPSTHPQGDYERYLNQLSNHIEHLQDDKHLGHNLFLIKKRNALKLFEEHCSVESLKEIFLQNSAGVTFLEDDEVKSCVQKILSRAFVPTVVHEMLHNFGVAHNMQGSSDKENYLTSEMIKEIYGEDVDVDYEGDSIGTNSIMDYFNYQSEALPYPSTYDFAILRYLYRNQIESEGVFYSLVDQDLSQEKNFTILKPIRDFETEKNLQTKTYGYCMQSETRWGLNPLCDTFDVGGSPEEIVRNYMDEYEYYNMYDFKRGVRKTFGRQTLRRKVGILFKVHNFYSQWRRELLNLFGQDNKYLEDYVYSVDYLNDFYDKLTQLQPEDRQRVLSYFKARNLSYSFYRDQVFKAPYTCVFLSPDQESVEYVDFDTIYKKLKNQSQEYRGLLITGCDSDPVVQVAQEIIKERVLFQDPEANFEAYTYFNEFGLPINNYNYDLSESKRNFGDYDISGTVFQKIYATVNLLGRHPVRVNLDHQYFYPTFMDEPDLRENYEHFMQVRYIGGAWLNPYRGSDIVNVDDSQEGERSSGGNTQFFRSFVQSPDSKKFIALMASYTEGDIKILEEDQVSASVSLSPGVLKGQPHYQNIFFMNRMGGQKTLSQIFADFYAKDIVKSFSSEEMVLPVMSQLFISSLEVPYSDVVTNKRKEPYRLAYTMRTDLDRARALNSHIIDLGNYYVYPKDDKAVLALRYISEIEKIDQMREGAYATSVDSKGVAELGAALLKRIWPSQNAPSTVLAYRNLFREIRDAADLASLKRFSESQLEKSFSEETYVALQEIILKSVEEAKQTLLISALSGSETSAQDRLGSRLSYGEALVEFKHLQASVVDLEAVGSHLLTRERDKAEADRLYYDQLLAALNQFEREEKLHKEDGSDLISFGDFVQLFIRNISTFEQIGQDYPLYEQEYQNSKEINSKFLKSLLFSR